MSARNTCHTTPARCVVIVTFNSAAHIGDCLRAVHDEAVVVVDNGSSDDTVPIATAFGKRVRVIANSSNRGFGPAANQGMRACGDADIVLVNPDVLVSPGTLDQLAHSARRAGAGLVAPRLLFPGGASQESARTFPTIYHLLGRRTRLRRTTIGRRWHEDSLPERSTSGLWRIDWAIGALMYLPRASVELIGGFDEQFFLYGEDVDLCVRLWRAGLPVLLDADATATHGYGRASKHTFDFRRAATRHHWASICRLAGKYPFQFFLRRPVVPSYVRSALLPNDYISDMTGADR